MVFLHPHEWMCGWPILHSKATYNIRPQTSVPFHNISLLGLLLFYLLPFLYEEKPLFSQLVTFPVQHTNAGVISISHSSFVIPNHFTVRLLVAPFNRISIDSQWVSAAENLWRSAYAYINPLITTIGQ